MALAALPGPILIVEDHKKTASGGLFSTPAGERAVKINSPFSQNTSFTPFIDDLEKSRINFTNAGPVS